MIYIASKQLQHERGDAAVDSYQNVHAGQDHVGCAGDLKEERGRVHQGGDGPPGKTMGKNMNQGQDETKQRQRKQRKEARRTHRAAAAEPGRAGLWRRRRPLVGNTQR